MHPNAASHLNVENCVTARDASYFVIPPEAIPFLPPEWRTEFHALREDGLQILQSVDKEITNLIRLANSLPAMSSLTYIQRRLATAEFRPTIEDVLEHEMLTLAFAVSYVRLVKGENGSGVSRKTLPPALRPVHDEIFALRNRRYAHNAGHESTDGEIEIGFQNGEFDLKISFRMGYYVRGAKEWERLVDFLNELMHTRLLKQLDRLTARTGRKWTFPDGPRPEWAEPTTRF